MTDTTGFGSQPHTGRPNHGPWSGRPALRTDRRRPLDTSGRVAPYRLLIEEGSDVFSRHDRAGRFLDVSPAAEDVFGVNRKAVLGHAWRNFVHPDDRLRFEGWWRDLHGGATTVIAFRIARPDGSIVRVETAACAGVLLEDSVFEVQAVTRQAPSVVETVDQMARKARELEVRAAQLDRANQDLARFAADTAHDLRAPLQIISGFAQLLAQRDGPRLDETSQRALAYILGAAGDMAALIDAALEQANPVAGQGGPGLVDSSDVARHAVSRLQAEIEASGARVEIRHLPAVYANAAQLGRVFQNLISNAVKSGAPGTAVRVVVSGRAVPGGWELSVSDNGVGIALSDRDHIFEMFVRCWRGPHTASSGIGLAICKSIVERHGGRIWIDDVEGGGSRFAFFLPEPSSTDHSPVQTGGTWDGRSC